VLFFIAFSPLACITIFWGNYIKNFVGYRALVPRGEIGKIVCKGEPVLLYFFNKNLAKRDLKNKMSYGDSVVEKKIAQMDELIRKASSGIRVCKINPYEDKDTFEKYKICDDVNSFINKYFYYHTLSERCFKDTSDTRIDAFLIVIISEGYIKEYWVGYFACKLGLLNFKIKNIGNILSKSVTKYISNNIFRFGLLLLFFLVIKNITLISCFLNSNSQLSVSIFMLPMISLSIVWFVISLKLDI